MSCSILSNLVMDFAHIKKLLVDKNGQYIQRLVAIMTSAASDHALKLRSTWVLKNLVYRADTAIKKTVLKFISWEDIQKLITYSEDSDNKKTNTTTASSSSTSSNAFNASTSDNALVSDSTSIPEQAIAFVRNLLHGEFSAVDAITKWRPQLTTDMIQVLKQCKASSSSQQQQEQQKGQCNNADAVLIQALFTLCNLAASDAQGVMTSGGQDLIQLLLEFMQHENKEVRATSVFVVINLTWKEHATNAGTSASGNSSTSGKDATMARIQQFQSVGMVEKLKSMMHTDKELDVRDRVRQALDQFE